MPPLPVADAARILQVRPGTLRRWLREGCPAVRHGRRGRGQAALVDPEQVRLWRDAGDQQRAMLELAGIIPDLLADAAAESLQHAIGVDKRRLAGVLAAAWYVSAARLLDHMRGQCPAVPDVTTIPEQIEVLRKIARNV
ncbi:helix-turn-helix domain-containing protein [Luteimonas sp. R10]|uniref:helix-turn-helix domain-containing protein n=1 Tax=Luteimonas sp. R10 TaxID=3108176 RepID=UPI003084BF3E|nr:helix-turn-helix domain-containing protein [Luteimonas sp. R10]